MNCTLHWPIKAIKKSKNMQNISSHIIIDKILKVLNDLKENFKKYLFVPFSLLKIVLNSV